MRFSHRLRPVFGQSTVALPKKNDLFYKESTVAKQLMSPMLVILVGLAWCLNILNVLPKVDWVWTIGLAAAGIAALVSGMNRLTVVVGPFLLLASISSVLRQTGHLPVNLEAPILTMVFGALWTVATAMQVRVPEALVMEPEQSKNA